MAIFRIYVEKKPAYAEESARLLGEDMRSFFSAALERRDG